MTENDFLSELSEAREEIMKRANAITDNPIAALELYQEAVLLLYCKLGDIPSGVDFTRYAVEAVLNLYKTRKSVCTEEATTQNIPVECIDNLPEELGVVARLIASGYDCDEIARILDVPPTTVKNRVYIAREKLGNVEDG